MGILVNDRLDAAPRPAQPQWRAEVREMLRGVTTSDVWGAWIRAAIVVALGVLVALPML